MMFRSADARLLPVLAAAAVAAAACLVLLGWRLDSDVLKSLAPGWPTMKPITALSLLLCSASLLLLARQTSPSLQATAGRVAAALVVLIGLVTLAEYAAGRDLGLDRLLLHDPIRTDGHVPSGRMALNSALALELVGLSLLLLDLPKRYKVRPEQLLTPLAVLICLVALLGYLYGVKSLLRIGPYSSIALHTVIAILALSLGLLAARPDRGWAAVLTSSTAGGVVARRMLPAALFVPPFLGWLRLLGQNAGWYQTEFGLALFASSNVVVFTLLTFWSAREIQRLDVRRKQAAVQRFNALIESAPDAMIMAAASGQIIHANTHAHSLFGYDPGELTGTSIDNLLPERQRSLHARHRAAYAIRPRARLMGAELELRALRKDASEFPVEISLSPVEVEDGELIFSAIRDMTERKRQEDLLREKNIALSNADRAKDRFLASMSHELRTPLNAIIGFAQLIHDEQVTADSPEHKEFLGYILSSGEHLLRLVNDVLDLSKIEAGKLVFQPQRVDLSQVLGEVLGILRTLIETRALRIEREVHPELTDIVIDAARLKQVIYNYVSNAIKFTSDGGRVAIRLRPEEEKPLLFRLEVSDTGAGIRAEDMKRLFLEFQQLASGSTATHPGTGLGLALTKRLVEAQGGFVGVSSTPGQGSTFYAVLPRRAHTVAAADLPAYASSATAD
jgi:PAS domain S-box-containing protein